VPHKCPMAPLEITFMLHDYFKDRGIRDKVQLHYTYPIGRVHSLENVAKWAAPEFERMGITVETLFNLKEVDGNAKVVKSEEGTETPFDLLVSIPAHRGMEVIEKNKLGAGGWIPTNRQQLNMEGRKNVFVIGDTTNIPISKAGSTAHFEAEALGDNLGVNAGLEGQGGVRVPEVMQADARQHRLLHRLPPVATDALRVEGGAVLGGEHKTGLDPAVVPVVLLLELSRCLGFEHLDGARVEGDHSPPLGRLRFADHDFSVDGDQGATHRKAGVLEVNV